MNYDYARGEKEVVDQTKVTAGSGKKGREKKEILSKNCSMALGDFQNKSPNRGETAVALEKNAERKGWFPALCNNARVLGGPAPHDNKSGGEGAKNGRGGRRKNPVVSEMVGGTRQATKGLRNSGGLTPTPKRGGDGGKRNGGAPLKFMDSDQNKGGPSGRGKKDGSSYETGAFGANRKTAPEKEEDLGTRVRGKGRGKVMCGRRRNAAKVGEKSENQKDEYWNQVGPGSSGVDLPP